ncbi:MAG: hypothetical protein AB1861_17360, partial [Cyanobacteriota bacterium]
DAVARLEKEMGGRDWERVGTILLDVKNSGLFIRSVNAGWPVFDAANLGALLSKIGSDVAKWAKDMAREFLKKFLVHRMVQQTITWIQGGGKPRFVTNWSSFMKGIGNEVAGDFLSKVSPRLCSSFGPLVRIALTPTNTAPETYVTCTLDQVMANVQDFYDDFNNGGWIAYGATLQPQNNFFGALMETSDLLTIKKAEEQEAKKSEVEAGSGYLGTQQCVKWEYVLETVPGNCDPATPQLCGGNATQEKRVCAEYKTTTPGDVVASSLSKATGANLDWIVNAQDLAALTNALLNSLMNKLITGMRDRDNDPGVLGVDPSELLAEGGDWSKVCAGLEREAYRSCKREVEMTCRQLPEDQEDDCLASIASEEEGSIVDPEDTTIDPPEEEGGSCPIRQGEMFDFFGQKNFRVFVSYFDALRASDETLDTDFAYLKAKGVGGIRIFPNWWLRDGSGGEPIPGDTLMDRDGNLREQQLSRLKNVLSKAESLGLVVDISFAREVAGLNVEQFTRGIVDATAQLAPYRNVIFDLQNERDLGRPEQDLAEAQVKNISQAVRAVDPSRILVASNSATGATGTVNFVKSTNLSGVAYHDPRNADWYEKTGLIVRSLLEAMKPVYLQEPQKYSGQSSLTPENFTLAIKRAKRAGAAAWTFHTDAGFNLGGSNTIQSQLQPVERAVLDNLGATLTGPTDTGCN